MCFYDGVLPAEERVEALEEILQELQRLSRALKATRCE